MLNIGEQIGHVVVVAEDNPHITPNGTKHRRYICQCECGNFKSFIEWNLKKSGDHANCGCVNRREVAERSRTHGKSYTKLYGIWGSMIKRCRNPKDYHYKQYGGRGITVCDEWFDYTTFESWALSNGYAEGLSIDRIEVNGNYCPQNCRWTTDYTQMNNRRNTYYLEYNGVRLSLSEWSAQTGLRRETIRQRILAGWSIEKALTTPLNANKSTIAQEVHTKENEDYAARI